METDCNPVEMPNNMGFEEDSDYRDFEGTDVKDMRLEAEAVVNDVLFAVSNMFVSKTLPCAEDVAYINVETRERNRYCLELTEAGLRVVAYDFDQTDDRLQTPYHETVYSLLDSLSPAYREVFGNALLQRLEALKKESEQVSVASYNNQKNWSPFKVSLSKTLKQYIETECYIDK